MGESSPTFTAPPGSWDQRTGTAAVADWRASGLSQAAWCRERGIPEHRLSYWKCRLDPERTSKSESAGVIAFSPVVERRQECGPGLEVVIDDPVRIRVLPGSDLALLRTVVEALR
jgi:hypothetical protein